jgi:hypothetical protein
MRLKGSAVQALPAANRFEYVIIRICQNMYSNIYNPFHDSNHIIAVDDNSR